MNSSEVSQSKKSFSICSRLDDCRCSGSEKRLQDCCSDGTSENCSWDQSVWVECTESKLVEIGPGGSGGTKTLSGSGVDSSGAVDNTFVCPRNVNKDNGLVIGGGVFPASDTFSVFQYDYAVDVSRVGSDDAWVWDLGFKCYRAGYRE